MNRVSVLMCVYREPLEYVSEAIDSILHQTFQNYEYIIILDDPQNNDLLELLREYENQEHRIKVFVNDTNVGLTKALNIGLVHCKGEYIVRIDADDISQPDRIAKQVAFMDSNKDIAASGTSAMVINAQGECCSKLKRKTDPLYLKTCSVFESPIFHPASIFRRLVDGTPVLYNEGLRYSQDYALWVTLMERHKVSNLEDFLIKYRYSDNQISSKRHFEQQECAKINQLAAAKMLQLSINSDDFEILSSFSRNPSTAFSINQIESFICRLLKNNKDNRCILYGVFRNHLLLIYYNYLPKFYGFATSICSYYRLSLKVGYFYIYGFISLINKYKKLWF